MILLRSAVFNILFFAGTVVFALALLPTLILPQTLLLPRMSLPYPLDDEEETQAVDDAIKHDPFTEMTPRLIDYRGGQISRGGVQAGADVVAAMRETVGPHMGVKASGGVRTAEEVETELSAFDQRASTAQATDIAVLVVAFAAAAVARFDRLPTAVFASVAIEVAVQGDDLLIAGIRDGLPLDSVPVFTERPVGPFQRTIRLPSSFLQCAGDPKRLISKLRLRSGL